MSWRRSAFNEVNDWALSLEEKTVLITGGLGGYGLAICDLILKRKGRVLLADIKPISAAEEILANQFKEAFEVVMGSGQVRVPKKSGFPPGFSGTWTHH